MIPTAPATRAARAFAPICAQLHDGREVVIRGIERGDAPGLIALYDSLDDDDRHWRFFSNFHPTAEFAERMTRISERGGFGLVALASAGSSGRRPAVVGEATYSLLANGNGDFAVTVAKAWRGGLGRQLLDALAAAATSNGVPNLEADMLIGNRPMIGATRARGYAIVDQPDWTTLRLVTGSSSAMPSWPGRDERRRVLVEGQRGRVVIGAEGNQILVCPGPADQRVGCPLLRHHGCPLAEGADVIVMTHAIEDPVWTQLVAAHHRRGRTVRIIEAAARSAPLRDQGDDHDGDGRPGEKVFASAPEALAALASGIGVTDDDQPRSSDGDIE